MNRESLIDDISLKEERLQQAKRSLQQADEQCNGGRHNWSHAKRDDKYTASYTIAGDPPGTMGVDWRGPCHVPAKTEKRWRRACKDCGKIEHTSRVDSAKQQVIESPSF